MKTRSKLSSRVSKAISNVEKKRLLEIARELGGYGLAIALPHIHSEAGVDVLPAEKIQYEKDLKVSFPDATEFDQTERRTFPAMWRFDEVKNKLVVCGRCECDD